MSKKGGLPATLLLLSIAVSASPTSFEYPMDVVVGARGQLYVSDQQASSIFLVSPDRKLSTIAQGKPAYRTALYRVRGIALDNQGHIVAADPASSEVYRVNLDGNLAALGAGKLSQPMDVAVDRNGDVIVADLGDEAIYRIPKEGAVQRVAQVPGARGVAVEDGSVLVISNRSLVRVTAAGKVEPVTSKDAFEFPGFVAVSASGDYLVSDGYAKAILKVSKAGKVAPVAKGSPLVNPQGIAIGPKGEVFVADPHAKAILVVSATGQVTTAFKP